VAMAVDAELGGLRFVLEIGSDQGLRKAGRTDAGVAAAINQHQWSQLRPLRLQIPVYYPSKDVIMMSSSDRELATIK
jgi:hypothetical protein